VRLTHSPELEPSVSRNGLLARPVPFVMSMLCPKSPLLDSAGSLLSDAALLGELDGEGGFDVDRGLFRLELWI
jgi:hypothetical protein